MHVQSNRQRQAFTLVELLVVIGIIAVLISILLPVIGIARKQAKTVKCSSNMRQVHQVLWLYAAENRGSLPWGWTFDKTIPDGPNTGSRAGTASSDNYYRDWTSTVAYYVNRQRPQADLAGNNRNGGFDVYKVIAPILQCAEVEKTTFGYASDFQIHPVICPDYFRENKRWWPPDDNWNGAGIEGTRKIAPARITDLYSDNAILWDKNTIATHVWGPFYDNIEHPTVGIGSYIDMGHLAYPLDTAARYRDDKMGDPLADDPEYAQNLPIRLPPPTADFDFNTDMVEINQQRVLVSSWQLGWVRFRHGSRNTVANVCFADGSVRQVSYNRNKLNPHTEMLENDFLRKYLMIKWPSNAKFVMP